MAGGLPVTANVDAVGLGVDRFRLLAGIPDPRLAGVGMRASAGPACRSTRDTPTAATISPSSPEEPGPARPCSRISIENVALVAQIGTRRLIILSGDPDETTLSRVPRDVLAWS